MQALQRSVQAIALGQSHGVANEVVDLLANAATPERVSHTTAMDLELEQQMEVTQLQRPSMLLGELAHPWQIVDDHSLNALPCLLRNGRQGLLPSRGALFAWEQQRVEEHGVVAAAGFQRRQIQHPWHPVELEPQPIGKQHQWSPRNLLGTWPSDKPLERLPESIPISRQCNACTSG